MHIPTHFLALHVHGPRFTSPKAQSKSLTVFFDSLYNPIVVSSNVGVNSRNSFSGTSNSPAYYSFKVWFVICISAHQGATRITLKCKCNAIVINKLNSSFKLIEQINMSP